MAVNFEIFVDKIEMIHCMHTAVNTNQRYLCVSKPRRFGKNMTADMLCTSYDREVKCHELLDKLRIAKLVDKTDTGIKGLRQYHHLKWWY